MRLGTLSRWVPQILTTPLNRDARIWTELAATLATLPFSLRTFLTNGTPTDAKLTSTRSTKLPSLSIHVSTESDRDEQASPRSQGECALPKLRMRFVPNDLCAALQDCAKGVRRVVQRTIHIGSIEHFETRWVPGSARTFCLGVDSPRRAFPSALTESYFVMLSPSFTHRSAPQSETTLVLASGGNRQRIVSPADEVDVYEL